MSSTTSSSSSAPPPPSAALLGTLPELERLIEQMSTALNPAMNTSYDRRQDHGAGDGYTEAMWPRLQARGFAVQTAHAGDIGDSAELHKLLHAVDDRSAAAAGHARDVHAAAAAPAGLAAMETSFEETRLSLGEAGLERLTATVSAYDEDVGTLTEDELAVRSFDHGGRPVLRWASRRGPLALDGRTRLDLAFAARTIAAADDRYLRDTAIQDTLRIDQDGTPTGGLA